MATGAGWPPEAIQALEFEKVPLWKLHSIIQSYGFYFYFCP